MNAEFVVAIRRSHLFILLLLSTVAVACRTDTSRSRVESPDWQRVERWLTCEECVDGERDSVVARGIAVVPSLTRALDGPPDSISQNFARSTGRTFRRMREQFDRQSPADQALRPLGDSAFIVGSAVANFQRAYRTRAAVALHAITPVNAKTLFRRLLSADSAGTIPPIDPTFRLVLDSLSKTPP